MTSFSGYYINREQSLMPNDHGLRRCKCGNFFLQSELITISEVDETDAPLAPRVPPEELPTAIAQTRTHAIELTARLGYWQHLNHAYRNLYRAHREAEDAATEAAWEADNPDRRTVWQSFRKMNRKPLYQPALDRAITFPVFEVSRAQHENISALLRLQQIIGSDSWIKNRSLRDSTRTVPAHCTKRSAPGGFESDCMSI